MHASDGADTTVDGIVRLALKADRLVSSCVADRHLRMCISATTRRMTAIGHGDPAMMPVRSDDRSNWLNRGCSNSAMNMVGTPYNAVHRAFATVSSTASGSKPSPENPAGGVGANRCGERHSAGSLLFYGLWRLDFLALLLLNSVVDYCLRG